MTILFMTLMESLRLAFVALRLNMLRSLLTTLGIIIGVAMVILMGAAGSGARQKIEEQIRLLGVDVLVVLPAPAAGGGYRGRAVTLLDEDMRAIKTHLPNVDAVSGFLTDPVTIVSGNANWSTSMQGVDAAYAKIYDVRMREGRFFDEREAQLGAKVVVLSATIATKLFNDESPIDKIVRIGSIPMKVIGVRIPQGQFAGQDFDDAVFVPLRTARSRLAHDDAGAPDKLTAIGAKLTPGSDLAAAQQDLISLMRERKHVPAGEQDVVKVVNTTQLMEILNATQLTLSWLVGAAAAISLIVGGVGIMNIMLVSVTERTKEIGLRLAIGARKSNILVQFLIEAIVLCFFGGAVGMAIGVALAFAVALVAGWPMIVGVAVLTLATSSAMAVGLVFGYFPAHRAAALDPIEALRHE